MGAKKSTETCGQTQKIKLTLNPSTGDHVRYEHGCEMMRESKRYLSARTLEHLRDGNDGDRFRDGGPDQDLGEGARLYSHVVGGQGADSVDIAWLGG